MKTYKKIIITTLCMLLVCSVMSQDKQFRLTIDPQMVLQEQSLDIRAEFKIDNIAIFYENFSNRGYQSFGLNYDFPIAEKGNFNNYLGLEVGEIIRKFEHNSGGYFYYGVNHKVTYWISDNFGLYLQNNFIRRTDLTAIYGSNADKFRYSNYLGIYITL